MEGAVWDGIGESDDPVPVRGYHDEEFVIHSVSLSEAADPLKCQRVLI